MVNKIEVTNQNIPNSVRLLIFPFLKIVELYECDTADELIDQMDKYPLNLKLFPQTVNGVTERLFLVGFALPSLHDNFTAPIVMFAMVKPEEESKYATIVREVNKNISNIWDVN